MCSNTTAVYTTNENNYSIQSMRRWADLQQESKYRKCTKRFLSFEKKRVFYHAQSRLFSNCFKNSDTDIWKNLTLIT